MSLKSIKKEDVGYFFLSNKAVGSNSQYIHYKFKFSIGFAKSVRHIKQEEERMAFMQNKVLPRRSTSSVLHSNANAYTVCDMRAVHAEYREMEETASKTENEMTHLNEFI